MKHALPAFGLTALLLLTLTGCIGGSNPPVNTTQTPSVTATPTTNPITTHFTPAGKNADAKKVADLLKKLPQDPDAVLSTSAKKQYSVDDVKTAFTGTTINPDQDSWHTLPTVNGNIQGVMEVTVTGGTADNAHTYAALMVYEKNQWKLLTTVLAQAG